MQHHQVSSRPNQQMLVSSPRCSLNCNGLSVHLPPLSDRRHHPNSYISPPMSASYGQTKFDDRTTSQYNGYHQQSPITSSHMSASSIRSPTVASAVQVNKAIARDPRSELSTPSGTTTSGASNPPTSEGTKASGDWADELSSAPLDSPEGQLVPGPPGIARRAKAHVPSACVNCKKKHLACETKRPCNRCTQNGKEASCVDVQHKKRGRPRLREDDNFRELALGGDPAYADVYQTEAGVLASAQPGRHRSKTYRELRSQPETPYPNQRPRTSDPTYSQHGYLGAGSLGYVHPAPSRSYDSNHIPTVLLTPDFVVAQHNQAFSDALSLQITARGQTLSDLVVPAEREKIRRLQALMRAEYHNAVHLARKHHELNTINTMPSIDQLDVIQATSGYHTRSEYWTFRLPRDQSRGFPISISLARDGGHFIVLTLLQSASALQSYSSAPMMQQPMMMSQASMSPGMPSPPNSLYHGQITPHRQQPNSPSDLAIPYLGSPAGPNFDDQFYPVPSSHGLAQYKANSPPRSVQMPYTTSRTNSSSSASLSGSEIPRSSMGNQSNQALPRDSLKHLQLPPIRTTPTSDPNTNKDSSHRRRHPTSTPSPARGSPHSSKRKKRRKVEIGDMLH